MLNIFNKLSKESLQNFEDFVQSPYSNKSKNVSKLFFYLKSKHPNVLKKHIEFEKVADKITRHGSFNKWSYHKIIAEFGSVFRNFLINEEIRKDKLSSSVKILDAMWKYDWESRFMKTYEKLRNMNKHATRDDSFYFNELKLLDYAFKKNYVRKSGFASDLLREVNACIDMMYAHFKMNFFFDMMVLENIHGKKLFKKTNSENVIEFIEQNEKLISDTDPILYIHYLAVKMTSSWDENDLKKYNDYYKKVKQTGNIGYMKVYFLRLDYHLRYGMFKMKNPSYSQELLNFYRKVYDNNFFELVFGEKILQYTAYLVMIRLFLADNQAAYAGKIIERTKSLIHEDFQNDTYFYSMALISFHKDNVDECFIYLNKLEVQRPEYYYLRKLLIAKIYFGKKKFSALDSVLNNITRKLRLDKKITENIKKDFMDETNMLRKISAFAQDPSAQTRGNASMLLKEAKQNLQAYTAPWYTKVVTSFKLVTS